MSLVTLGLLLNEDFVHLFSRGFTDQYDSHIHNVCDTFIFGSSVNSASVLIFRDLLDDVFAQAPVKRAKRLHAPLVQTVFNVTCSILEYHINTCTVPESLRITPLAASAEINQ